MRPENYRNIRLPRKTFLGGLPKLQQTKMPQGERMLALRSERKLLYIKDTEEHVLKR